MTHTEDKKKLGSKIRTRRLQRLHTLQTLADEVGKAKSFIWRIEKGHDAPSVFLLRDIAKVLKISVDKLLSE